MWKCIEKVRQEGEHTVWVHVRFSLVGEGRSGAATVTMKEELDHYTEGAEYTALEANVVERSPQGLAERDAFAENRAAMGFASQAELQAQTFASQAELQAQINASQGQTRGSRKRGA